MRCHSYKKLIVLYLHGELEGDKQHLLEQHLDRCVACKEVLDAFRTVIDRVEPKEAEMPSTHAVDEIRHAARLSIEDVGRRVPRVVWGGPLYGARASVLAVAASILMIAAVGVFVTRMGRGPTGPESQPARIAAQPPVYLRTTDETGPGAEVLPRQPETFVPATGVPLGLETRLANLEVDTYYMGRELALEMAPTLDRRFQSLEDGVVTLGLELQ